MPTRCNGRTRIPTEWASTSTDLLSSLTRTQRNQIHRTLLLLSQSSGSKGASTALLPGTSGRPGSPGQKILQRIAETFVRTGPRVTLLDLLQLAPDQLSAVSRLLDTLALGPEAVDWWLTDYAAEGRVLAGRFRATSQAASG